MTFPRRLFLGLLLAVPVAIHSAAAQDATLLGTVRDATDGTPIADAIVRALDGGHGVVARSGSAGGFVLRIGPGPQRVVAARIGFAPETLAVAGADTVVEFRLRPSTVELDPITVAAEPVFSTASSRTVRELDLHLRPRETAQELLRFAPGLVIAQHAGGGKAEQIFLRGFDADHGTDVAISVDGVPANMVSHAHGQGYADLHFVMPEVVDLIEVRKGPYDAQDGDLATAGAVALRTRDRAPGRVAARAGTFGTVHGLAIVPFGGAADRAGGYVAASGHFSDGPFVAPQGYERLNGFAKFTAPVGSDAELVASGSAFRSIWDASGQIPERAVASGLISRFGAIDPSEGGRTSRYDVLVGLRSRGTGERSWDLRAYAVKYDFRLFSNFTFFLRDPVNGDGIDQSDDRTLAGLTGTWTTPSRVAGLGGRTTVGAGVRADRAEVELGAQVRRAPLDRWVRARIAQEHGFLWLRQDLRLGARTRLQLGARGDLFRFDVTDRLVPAGDPSSISGTRTVGTVSPKLNLAHQVSATTTLFANAGTGFHSNDARDAVAAKGARVVPRAVGAELGARHVWRGGSVAAALWGLDLQSELVYVGDEGVTEASGRTRRVGVDLEARWRLLRWLWLDADLNLSRGRFRDEPDGADRIPLAPTITSAGGLTVRDLGAFGGGLRYRAVGARAADETNTVRARGYGVAELFASWTGSAIEVVLAVDNLFDTEWNEAQFATTSRLRDEPEPVTELHFTPGAGRVVQVGVGYRF